MSNSNDDNKALTSFNEKLPVEQNEDIELFIKIRERISSCVVYNDQEFYNILRKFTNVVFPILITQNKYSLAECIIYLLSNATLSIDYKKWIMNSLICFVEKNQREAFRDFFKQNILPCVYDQEIIKNQILSQNRINEKLALTQIEINEEQEKAQIRINEYYQKKKIDAELELWIREEKHNQNLRFAADAKKSKEEEAHAQATTDFEIVTINYLELEESFIKEKWLVRIMRDGEPKIYYWDDEKKRYAYFATKISLTSALTIYAYENHGKQIKLSSTELDYIVNRMMASSVPLLKNAEFVQPSKPTQIFFQNGYADLIARRFIWDDPRKYFHIFCLPYDWPSDDLSTLNFDELLDYIFNSDQTKKTLVYEIIGAFLSNLIVKHIFVFQGVSNGGKSTLAEIIMKLFCEDEIKYIGSINEINETKSKSYEGRIKLLYIDDAPNEKWNPQTVSYLKTRSRGIQSGDNTRISMFKILLCTNYPITFKTENGRDESMESRIVVVPFEKALQSFKKENARIIEIITNFLNGQFDNERPHIAKKALTHFANICGNLQRFSHQYLLNECVINSGTYPSNIINDAVAEAELKAITNIGKEKQTISDKNPRLIEFLQSRFELTDNENEFITVGDVLKVIKTFMPDTNGRVNDVGVPIKAVFGEDCIWRKNNKTRYKIKLKTQDS